MAKIVNFNDYAKIDSLRIEIPLADVKLISSVLECELYLVSKDGEIIEESFKQSSEPIHENGIKTRYLISSRHDFKTKRQVKYLYILFNSKLLGVNYFDGITKKTIRQIYDCIISHRVVSFSYKVFLSGKVSDIDICRDFYKNDEGFERLIDEVKRIVSITKRVPIKSFNKQKNKGFQLSNREGQNPNKLPFIKWYSKVVELQNNSQEFYSVFFKHVIERDLGKWIDQYRCVRRVEVTVKNRKHLQHLVNDSKQQNTLKDILSVDFQKIIDKIIGIYIDTQKKFKPMKELSGNNLVIAYISQKLVDSIEGMVNEDLIKEIGSLFENKTERKRKKDLIRDMLDVDILEKKKQADTRLLLHELTTGVFPTMM